MIFLSTPLVLCSRAMKSRPLRLLTALLLPAALLTAQDAPNEDDFLLFDKIEEDHRAELANTAPLPEESPPASRRKLPGPARATIRTILLEVPDKSFATGRLSTLIAEAKQSGTAATPAIIFRDATVTLQTSLNTVAAALVAQNDKFPDGVTLAVKAGDGYGAHERDVAGLAAAILLDAIGNGRSLDPETVLLGGVDTKGTLTAAGHLATRIRTLEGSPPPVIGVPMASEADVRDLALMDELDVLARQQIIALRSLDDARAISAKERPEAVAKALALFAGVREASARTPVKTLLRNPRFLQRLQGITALTPNHLSAKLLLQAAAGKVPGRITFATSVQAMLKGIKPFMDAAGSGKTLKEIQTAANEGGNVLQRIQSRIHPSVERYLMAMKAYLRSFSNLLAIPDTPRHIDLRNKAHAEVYKLRGEVETEKKKIEEKAVTRE